MLGLRRSTIPAVGGEKVPCVQCDRREYGLAWGDYCSVCKERRRRCAEARAQRIAIVAALLMAGYLLWRTPADLGQRIFAGASVLLVYLIIRRVVSRMLQEYMPKELRPPTTAEPGPTGEEDPS
jgi:hypothetical protein